MTMRRWYRHSNGLLYSFPPVAGGSPVIVPPMLEQVRQTNLTAAARAGTTVTAGATAHTMGSPVSLIDPTDFPSYGIAVQITDVHTNAARTSFLMDLGFEPSGGGTFRVLLPFLDCWGAGIGATQAEQPKGWVFPVYVPPGVRVSARAQAVIVSDTAVVSVWLAQKPLYPFIVLRWEAYGVVASASNGTPVTPANGAFGSWTQIPASTTTSRAHNFWTAGYGGGTDTSISTISVLVEIGHGPSDPPQTIGTFQFRQYEGEAVGGPGPDTPIYHPVPSGQQLWARIASNETEVRTVIIYAGD